MDCVGPHAWQIIIQPRIHNNHLVQSLRSTTAAAAATALRWLVVYNVVAAARSVTSCWERVANSCSRCSPVSRYRIVTSSACVRSSVHMLTGVADAQARDTPSIFSDVRTTVLRAARHLLRRRQVCSFASWTTCSVSLSSCLKHDTYLTCYNFVDTSWFLSNNQSINLCSYDPMALYKYVYYYYLLLLLSKIKPGCTKFRVAHLIWILKARATEKFGTKVEGHNGRMGAVPHWGPVQSSDG